MDALDLLEEQHRELAELIDQVAAEPSPGRRTALVTRLVRAVDAHARVEELYLYPLCAERTNGDRTKVYEAYELHALARFAAGNLLRTRVTDVRFAARLKLLRERLEQHAFADEDWMFQKAKRALTDERLDELGDEIARAHEQLTRFSAPATTPTSTGGAQQGRRKDARSRTAQTLIFRRGATASRRRTSSPARQAS